MLGIIARILISPPIKTASGRATENLYSSSISPPVCGNVQIGTGSLTWPDPFKAQSRRSGKPCHYPLDSPLFMSCHIAYSRIVPSPPSFPPGRNTVRAYKRGPESNWRPSGYEPDELPLLHPTKRRAPEDPAYPFIRFRGSRLSGLSAYVLPVFP